MAGQGQQHTARKRFGQNFLQDHTVIERIVSMVQPKAGDNCVEIGPGLGALTLPLLKACGSLQVVELDRDIIPKLRATLAGLGELKVFESDVLNFDFHLCEKPDHKIRLVGNLPYNISTPLLFHVFEHIDLIQDMHFMLQKEVVDRMASGPGSKLYGRLSVMVQYYCDAQSLFDVPPEAFCPAPKVTSSIVRLRPHALPEKAKDEALFATLVREAFGQRRKTISNSLKAYCTAEDFAACHIDPRARAENLSLSDFIRIANYLEMRRDSM
jgi:16S rRNA (adenine1518-N6/adenine1519-N6)-dimethyltransferase